MSNVASLIVRIGAQDQEIAKALAGVTTDAKTTDQALKQLGNQPVGAQAQKSIENFNATLKQVTDAYARSAEKAQLTAQGLTAIGGASALTDRDLKSVNKTLQDGLAAFEAMGQKAPASLQKTADAVANAQKSTSSFASGLGQVNSVLGLFGASLSLGALV